MRRSSWYARRARRRCRQSPRRSVHPPADSCATDGLGMPTTSLAAIKVLRLMAAGDLQMYRRLKLDGALMNEIEHVLTTQLEHHLDRRLKSLQFLHSMYPSPALGEGQGEGLGPSIATS